MVNVRFQSDTGATARVNADIELRKAVKFHERVVIAGAVASSIAVLQITYKLFQDPNIFFSTPHHGGDKVVFSPPEIIPLALGITCGIVSIFAYDRVLRKNAQYRSATELETAKDRF